MTRKVLLLLTACCIVRDGLAKAVIVSGKLLDTSDLNYNRPFYSFPNNEGMGYDFRYGDYNSKNSYSGNPSYYDPSETYSRNRNMYTDYQEPYRPNYYEGLGNPQYSNAFNGNDYQYSTLSTPTEEWYVTPRNTFESTHLMAPSPWSLSGSTTYYEAQPKPSYTSQYFNSYSTQRPQYYSSWTQGY